MMRHHPGLCGWWEIELYRAGDSYRLETSSTKPVGFVCVATFGELLSKKRPHRTSAEGVEQLRDTIYVIFLCGSAPRARDLE